MNHQPFWPGAMNPLSLCQGDESSLVMFKIKQSRNIQSGELTKMYILGDKFPLFLYAGAMNPLSLFRCVPELRKIPKWTPPCQIYQRFLKLARLTDSLQSIKQFLIISLLQRQRLYSFITLIFLIIF